MSPTGSSPASATRSESSPGCGYQLPPPSCQSLGWCSQGCSIKSHVCHETQSQVPAHSHVPHCAHCPTHPHAPRNLTISNPSSPPQCTFWSSSCQGPQGQSVKSPPNCACLPCTQPPGDKSLWCEGLTSTGFYNIGFLKLSLFSDFARGYILFS